jgi:hypothetical protein
MAGMYTIPLPIRYQPVGANNLVAPIVASPTPITLQGISPVVNRQLAAFRDEVFRQYPIPAPGTVNQPIVVVKTTSNGGLAMGVENKIGEITVHASKKDPTKINDIRFSVVSQNFAVMPTFTQARIADGTTTIVGSSCGQGIAGQASQTIFCEFGTVGNTMASAITNSNVESNTDFDGYMIPAGTSKTFSLYATVNGVLGSGTPSISTSLVASGFNWDDASSATYVADGAPASPGNGTNLTGALIKNFPTGSYVIHA